MAGHCQLTERGRVVSRRRGPRFQRLSWVALGLTTRDELPKLESIDAAPDHFAFLG